MNRSSSLESSILQTLRQQEQERTMGLPGWNIEVRLAKRDHRSFTLPVVRIKGWTKKHSEAPHIKAIVVDLKEQTFQVKTHTRQTRELLPPMPLTLNEILLDAVLFSIKTEEVQSAIDRMSAASGTPAPVIVLADRRHSPSTDWFAEAREWIVAHYGVSYLASSPRPIRADRAGDFVLLPGRPALTPKKMKKELDQVCWRVYSRIWERALTSQMTGAQVQRMNLEVVAGAGGRYLLHRQGEELLERGYLQALSLQKPGRSTAFLSKDHPLFQSGEELTLVEVLAQRRSEETNHAVSAIELYRSRAGLAPVSAVDFRLALSRLQAEGYLDHDESGIRLNDYGRQTAERLINDRAVQEDEADCPLCGKSLKLVQGPFGPFWGCSDFPRCRFTRSVHLKISCPLPGCGGWVVERQGKSGRRFYGCSRYPECTFISWEKPTDLLCPVCQRTMLVEKADDNGGVVLYCSTCRSSRPRNATGDS
ncbi:hypothetical protein GX408_05645 [bacterium]|nr:hypothetical protein [bacterium]